MKADQPGYQDAEGNTRLLSTFGHLIAAGTADNAPVQLPKRFIDDLLEPLDQHNQDGVDAAWGLSEIMTAAGNPQTGRGFLKQVGDKLYGLQHGLDASNSALYLDGANRSVIDNGNPRGIDPSGWYLSQLGHDPLASQDFFLNADRTKF